MRRTAAAGRGISQGFRNECNWRAVLTSISHLARVTACALVAVGWECRADFAQRLECCAVTRSLILCQCDFFLFAGLGVFDGNGKWHDLVVEPASLLRSLRPLI